MHKFIFFLQAANPGCVLEDFLRWHSPRDILDGINTLKYYIFLSTLSLGELSERMKLPGNLWRENWESARPIPASQQNRLFNETKEVEQVTVDKEIFTYSLLDFSNVLFAQAWGINWPLATHCQC